MTNDGNGSAQRRAMLAYGAALAGSLATGCSLFSKQPLAPVCPSSPDVSNPDGPLTIDAHCHVFNGTDLQVKEFVSKVLVNQGGPLGAAAEAVGSILQQVAWSKAPTGPAELAELEVLAKALESCSANEHTKQLDALRQKAYTQGRIELQAAIRRSPELQSLRQSRLANGAAFTTDAVSAAKLQAIDVIDSLKPDINDYKADRKVQNANALVKQGPTIEGMIHFVVQNFQYRYVSVHDYLDTYNRKGSRFVDLMLPSMVDYDYWLAKGESTLTPLRSQVEVMQKISVLTRGRVHCLVPFDPLRQVAYNLKLGTESEDPFNVVTDAVEKMGCVGVKLYPPMGFAAADNKKVQEAKGQGFWMHKGTPTWVNRSDLGGLLDEAMARLFKWCQDKHVPVMAHTSQSNGVSKDFEELAGAKYWKSALDAFPGLRVSFGHFGDSKLAKDGLEHARSFAKLMDGDKAKAGAFAYADAGYFVEVLGRDPALRDSIRQLYVETAPKGGAALANRFMYGTDWEMTLAEGAISDYLADFVQLFGELENNQALKSKGIAGLSDKFFGRNAVDWLGLQQGGKARLRLDDFYAANKVPTPDWVKKVDQA